MIEGTLKKVSSAIIMLSRLTFEPLLNKRTQAKKILLVIFRGTVQNIFDSSEIPQKCQLYPSFGAPDSDEPYDKNIFIIVYCI